MRFRLGPPPESTGFVPDESWNLLQEPSPWGFQLKAIPIAVGVALLLSALWLVLTPLRQAFLASAFPLPAGRIAACLVGVIVIHELIHLAMQPHLGTSPHAVLGFWPSRIFLYTMYVGDLSKERCMAILMAPFVAISVVPLFLAAVTGVGPVLLAYASIVNGFIASGDLLAAGMTARCIPRKAVIRTRGWSTYWRVEG